MHVATIIPTGGERLSRHAVRRSAGRESVAWQGRPVINAATVIIGFGRSLVISARIDFSESNSKVYIQEQYWQV